MDRNKLYRLITTVAWWRQVPANLSVATATCHYNFDRLAPCGWWAFIDITRKPS